MAEYKVLITTSGLGSRLGNLTKFTNKGLVRIGKKPALSYIIESYPNDVEFVITLGHYGNQVEQFLNLAYPDKNIKYIPVENYDGKGSSLLYSMSLCESELQCPFIFHACDTVVEKEEFDFSSNWVAGHKNGSSFQYRTLNVRSGSLLKINQKGEEFFDYVYIGLCGIKDYELFWKYTNDILEETSDNSLSDCHVISKMMDHLNFSVINYRTWYDIGNVDSLKKSRKAVPDKFHLLDKEDESIFIFDDNFVIKFFYDKQVCWNRVDRMLALKGLSPNYLASTDNFYKYEYAKGDTYSRVVDANNFKKFLNWSKQNLWKKNDADISDICEEFYFTKTYKRIVKYLTDNGMGTDDVCFINGEEVPSIFDLIKNVDKKYISCSKGYQFHGDYVLENIIHNNGDYILIDWRQDFGGDKYNGDIYYDLAKLKHNLTVNHDILDKELYIIDVNNKIVKVDILRSNEKCECIKILEDWIESEGLDNKKVDIIKSLIWINMAPLHPQPIGDFLFYFGKYNLYLNL